jgi:hypothetical protein
MAKLFRDWAMVARELKRIPSSSEYSFHGKYSEGPLRERFGTWAQVAPGLRRHVQRHGLQEEYKDVLAMIDRLDPEIEGKRGRAYGLAYPAEPAPGALREGRAIEGRPLYGAPMKPCALAYCSTNEAGVICLFGSLAVELGFMGPLSAQVGFAAASNPGPAEQIPHRRARDLCMIEKLFGWRLGSGWHLAGRRAMSGESVFTTEARRRGGDFARRFARMGADGRA